MEKNNNHFYLYCRVLSKLKSRAKQTNPLREAKILHPIEFVLYKYTYRFPRILSNNVFSNLFLNFSNKTKRAKRKEKRKQKSSE